MESALDIRGWLETLTGVTEAEKNRQLQSDLTRLLSGRFESMSVEVSHGRRWGRTCVTFCWSGFASLLPEERFHRLVQVIPEKFRESSMSGLVWLELAPGESVESFLKLPRSEDVVDSEGAVYADLCRVGFFEGLTTTMRPSPDKSCGGDLSAAVDVLSDKGWSHDDVRRAKLVFIRYGAYCDCQVLKSVRAELAKRYAGAA